MKREQWRAQAHACSAAVHDAGDLVSWGSEVQEVGCPGVESPKVLASRGSEIQRVWRLGG